MAIQKQGAGADKSSALVPIPDAVKPIAGDEPDDAGGFDKALEDLIAKGAAPQAPTVDIAALVQAEVAKLVAGGAFAPAAQNAQPKAPEPPKFKKHYKNDLRPDEIVQALDMSALDRGERPQANPIPGHYYKFRLGHRFTNDDNEIRQLDWMLGRPALDHEGNTIGGAPHIYEDDGSVLLSCASCEKTFASKAAFAAHQRGVHGVTIS